MLNQYLFIGILALASFAVPVIGIGFAWLISPKRANPLKRSIYECGLETIGETWVQFRVQYYIYALVFAVFDVEIAFLLPWAVAYNRLGLVALVDVVIFLGILATALAYAWRKGALRWS
ncbi:MAG: NADH-quinone oxidoreductase subunit A [Chloroflexi bacterium]|nr:MAG: NADH-quinone oxidoreductase subunit A [Chloroflexota bacterium]HDN79151.1 NADH-quinone oxidoreductase subunit A [Chloroflexota bacterium]